MTKTQIKTPAQIKEEVVETYFRLTDDATAQVDVSIEVRRVLREMFMSLSVDLTVADLREHLEEYWS
ncbi:hypothetical protein CGLAMM_01275 [Acetobacteraceae bacterium EV16G]|uniref:Uncharacterized protein n=1 Tax=Sorlinia euscelidii TaxID=3081148 RepID=A0ABU7U4L4_9PROT